MGRDEDSAPVPTSPPIPPSTLNSIKFAQSPKKCTGCGVPFQTHDPTNLGYILSESIIKHSSFQPPIPAADESFVTPIICHRCRDLLHHNASTISIPRISPEKLNLNQLRKTLVLQFVDLLDFPSSYFSLHQFGFSLRTPYILVFNKCDLLPETATQERLLQWATHFTARLGLKGLRAPAAIHVISSKSGLNIRPLMQSIQRLRLIHQLKNVTLVGSTNVGKSEFINCLHRMCQIPKSVGKLTTSRVPGTTVQTIEIPLQRFQSLLQVPKEIASPLLKWDLQGSLIDSPGVYLPTRLENWVPPVKELRYLQWSKRLQPVTYQIPAGKSIFLGGLGRLDYVSGTSESRLKITIWVGPLLPIHVTSIDKANQFCKTNLFQLEQQEGRDSVSQISPNGISQEAATSNRPESSSETNPNPPDLLGLDSQEPQERALVKLPVERSLPDFLIPPSLEHRAQLPDWKLAGEWQIQGHGDQRNWVDFTFGGLGWLSICGDFEMAQFQAFTPNGQGVVSRDALMPFDFGSKKIKIQ
jgi:ribosome biogenesis GTPase A